MNVTISLDPRSSVAPVPRRLFGSFVEHLGRCVYGGIYEPGHPTATPEGFRQDVIDLVRELGSTTVRYPGGNFVSGYQWEDGIGPRESRPTRLDAAWHSIETNEVGVDEFAHWCRLTGQELMMAVNLGTRGILDAMRLQEYMNHPGGTTLSEQRIANGSLEPYNVRIWCLGNEMDGPWQLGYMSADDYGALANRTAIAMRQLDPSLELVVCGSSGSEIATFGDWERAVLGHCYDSVDYVSCHAYYQLRDGDLGAFLASSLDMEHFMETVINAADLVKAIRRSDKTIRLSFDEWNIWYLDEHMLTSQEGEEWQVAPHLIEDTYTLADAVVLGNLLITLIQHCDRVGAASLAQLVNAIAPIRTEPGGSAWRQSTFHPFSITSRLAQGVALRPGVVCGTYSTGKHDKVPLVDAVATYDETAGRAAVFLVNRDLERALPVDVEIARLGMTTVVESVSLAGDDPFATNSADQPDRVAPQDNPARVEDGVLRVVLPPLSWSAIGLTA